MADDPRRLTVSEKDEDHFIFEREGFQCQVCGEIGHPHDLDEDLMLAHPPFAEGGPINLIPVCGNCWRAHTPEQLDEYVEEMQEHQQALEEDRGDYAENQGQAFDRDDHTCQLCGNEGIPKAERGLIAYPVCAGDYHLDNLVTICDDCLTETLDSDEDEQTAADRLRMRAARAKKWRDSDAEDADEDKTAGGDTAP